MRRPQTNLQKANQLADFVEKIETGRLTNGNGVGGWSRQPFMLHGKPHLPCGKCSRVLPVEAFTCDGSTTSRRAGWCRDCQAVDGKARRQAKVVHRVP